MAQDGIIFRRRRLLLVSLKILGFARLLELLFGAQNSLFSSIVSAE
jgi:hypothetical protein